MATKSSTPTATSLRAKTTKTDVVKDKQQVNQSNARSVAGVNPAREQVITPTSVPKVASKAATTPKIAIPDGTSSTATKTRRKPRKLHKDVAENFRADCAKTKVEAYTDPEAISELDALKSRVRGLEAKVEQLYKSSTPNVPSRSPRRRGKNHKASSSTPIPTLKTMPNSAKAEAEEQDVEDEADEELVHLEEELETARRDLDSYRPHAETLSHHESEDDIEEIPRNASDEAAPKIPGNRQVTLSGSYRIPIPANVSVDDVKTIKSGVTAAQNVARTFLEQRRAAAALKADPTPASSQPFATSRGASSSVEREADNSTTGASRQSWGQWVGGYSLAITRAVKSIEHEAAVGSHGGSQRVGSPPAKPLSGASAMEKGAGKRPVAKTKLSSEQVRGLMR